MRTAQRELNLSGTLIQRGKKQYGDYTEDVSVSGVYSISYANPLPKSDLSCDGQIIQLSEVSGMVTASQLFCPLVFTDFLSAHEKTSCRPPCRALNTGWRSHSPPSLPLEKNRMSFPSADKEKLNYFLKKLAICPSGKGGLNGHDPQINVFQASKLKCAIYSHSYHMGKKKKTKPKTSIPHQKAVREANVGLR